MIHVNLELMSASRPEVFGQANLSNGRLPANKRRPAQTKTAPEGAAID